MLDAHARTRERTSERENAMNTHTHEMLVAEAAARALVERLPQTTDAELLDEYAQAFELHDIDRMLLLRDAVLDRMAAWRRHV